MMDATREALGLYWVAAEGVPHHPYDAALAEVAAAEAVIEAARAHALLDSNLRRALRALDATGKEPT
jgi:hypothetical protein